MVRIDTTMAMNFEDKEICFPNQLLLPSGHLFAKQTS